MPFRLLNQCTDCESIVDNVKNHDCPKDPMKDPVKRAAAKAWEAEFDRKTKVWDDWQEVNAPDIEYARPSVNSNPTYIAFQGKCVIFGLGGEFWDEDGEDFVTNVLNNPTWGDVLIEFEKAIHTIKDTHHRFLEGLYPVDIKDWPNVVRKAVSDPNVTVLRFSTGS